MSKFCGKCGNKLDDKTGLCPNCNKEELQKTILTESKERLEHQEDNTVQEIPIQQEKPLTAKQKREKKKAEKRTRKEQIKASRTFGQKVKRFFAFLLVWLLVLSIALASVVGVLSYFDFVKVPFFDSFFSLVSLKHEQDEAAYFSIEGTISNDVVTDFDTAVKTVQEATLRLGYTNAFDDLSQKSIDEFEGITYYRLQQNYNGIPIYGRSVVVTCDSNGNVTGISGNVTDLPINFIIETLITQKQVQSQLKKYFLENIVNTCEYFEIQDLSKSVLYLYNLTDPHEFSLVYEVVVSTEYGPYVALINAKTAEVIMMKSSLENVQTNVTMQGQIEKQSFIAEKNNNQFSMEFLPSVSTNYSVYTPEEGHLYDYYLDKDNARIVTWSKGSTTDKSAVDAIANVEKVYDYYLKTFNRDSLDGQGSSLNVYVQTAGYKNTNGSDKDNYNNAFYWGGQGYSEIDIISFPKCYTDSTHATETKSYSCELDVIGHEMTHGIVDHTCSLEETESNNMPGAINEAVADIFGFFIEAKSNKTEPDWTNSVRTAIKANNTDSDQLYHFSNYTKKTECHKGATIVTYAAYLMYNGVNGLYSNLSVSDLEKIWYRALLTMPSDSSFQILRYNVEVAAENMGLSNAKKECIAAAFDEVGINSWANQKGDEYNIDSEIIVLDKDGAKYDNYTISITGQKYTGLFGWGWFREDYSRSFSVNTTDAQQIHLDKGEYTIKVIDNVDISKSQENTVKVTSKGKYKLLKYSTNFDKNNRNDTENLPNNEISIERDVVLVLDASGSMEGTPLDETKKAATKFVDTVFEQSASVGVVKYDSEAEIVSPFSTDNASLKSSINNIRTGGSTDIEDGLATAEAMLSRSSTKKKIIVLMSDGVPNDGKVGEELIAYADELKQKDIYIYTLGFFEDLGSEKSNAQYLMERIASTGCHYEVTDANSLVYFFGDIADQINGQKYIYVRIACPVDVSVSYAGEELDSSSNNLNTRTSFGTLTFEDASDYGNYDSSYYSDSSDSDDTVKVLRLKEGTDYDVKIVGTGSGRMNYSIGFMDNEGEYTDLRRFNNIRITRRTVIDTVAEVSDNTILNVDEDGDGRYDIKYKAAANGYGKEVNYSYIVYILLSLVGILLILISILIIKTKINKKRKAR